MRAYRLATRNDGTEPYSATNPPTSSALRLVSDLPRPEPREPGDVVVKVKATTVVRDNLTWPELYSERPAHVGNDFAGEVVSVHAGDDPLSNNSGFQIGDEVFGMISAHRGGAWSEYVLLKPGEAYAKPKNLSWAEAAALPLSALTADQALFQHAKLDTDGRTPQRILITGAAGGVGMYLVQFARAAGHHVTAASSSNARNQDYLIGIGAQQVIQYDALASGQDFDVVIDTTGADVLRRCWQAVRPKGTLITIDSASWDFVEVHGAEGLGKGKDVRAVFFIVEPSAESMARISQAASAGLVKGTVLRTLPFEDGQAAYEFGHARNVGRGKVVLTIGA